VLANLRSSVAVIGRDSSVSLVNVYSLGFTVFTRRYIFSRAWEIDAGIFWHYARIVVGI
jgi:hypothetical protein